MKPSKETLLNSYIDVQGWSEEDVKKAAEWLAEETGLVVDNIEIIPDYHFLLADDQECLIWVCDRTGVKYKTQLTDLSFMTSKEEPMNTLETLKKAKKELALAQETVEKAQKAYTEAYKAFKKEADGLLREDEETPEMCSDGGSKDYSEEFVALYAPVTEVRLEDMIEGFDYNIERKGETYWFYDDVGDINVIRDSYSFTKLFKRV